MAQQRLRIVKEENASLSSEMQKLGFTDYEARIYIQLLQISPATAYEISKAAGVPRSNAYSALESLARKSAVHPISQDPVRYAAVDPQVMLDTIARSTKELCGDLAASLAKVGKVEDTHYVWTAWGDTAVHDRVDALIRGAERCIWIKASDRILRRHADALRDAANRGLEILVVLFGDDPEEFRYSDTVRVYPHDGNGMRTIVADNVFTFTADHEEALAANSHGELFASYTRNLSIVTMAEALIRHDVYVADIFAHMGPEFRAQFEPRFMELRRSCFTPKQFEELVRRAQEL